MKKFKKHIMVSAVLLIILVSSVAFGQTNTNPVEQVKKFLTGIQKQDFKSIFDMTWYYQNELNKIRSNNPEVLWPKSTAEYYELKIDALYNQRFRQTKSFNDVWVNSRVEVDLWGMGNEFFDTADPAENIQMLMDLLTLSPYPEWKIIESKKEKQFDSMEGRYYDVYVVYVSLKYKTVEEFLLIGSRVLKEAIIGFVLGAKTGLYVWSGRVEKGDVYW